MTSSLVLRRSPCRPASEVRGQEWSRRPHGVSWRVGGCWVRGCGRVLAGLGGLLGVLVGSRSGLCGVRCDGGATGLHRSQSVQSQAISGLARTIRLSST